MHLRVPMKLIVAQTSEVRASGHILSSPELVATDSHLLFSQRHGSWVKIDEVRHFCSVLTFAHSWLWSMSKGKPQYGVRKMRSRRVLSSLVMAAARRFRATACDSKVEIKRRSAQETILL